MDVAWDMVKLFFSILFMISCVAHASKRFREMDDYAKKKEWVSVVYNLFCATLFSGMAIISFYVAKTSYNYIEIALFWMTS